jgi:tyrosinase
VYLLPKNALSTDSLSSNVDRIFAIWQALNPNSYVTPVRNPYATFLMPKDFVADTNTVLAPFHKNDRGDFWTSETCRSTNVFAYTYPELVGVGNNTDSLKTKVNSLYGPDAITPRKRSHTPGHIAGAPNFAQRRQYTVDIKAYKFCVDGSFNVHIFLGPKPGSDAKNYSNEPSFIGMTGILSQSQGADTPNNNIGVHGAVPLTAALESKLCTGEIPNLTEGAVAAYLKENMTWRISKMNGDQVSVDDMPGFQVSVLWAEVEPAKDECDFPEIVSDYKVLADATNGLPGGFSPGDSL